MAKLRFAGCVLSLTLLLMACTVTPAPTYTVDPGTPTASVTLEPTETATATATPPVSPISPPITPTPPLSATATAIALPPTPVSPLPTPGSPLPTPQAPQTPLLPQSGEPEAPYAVELSGTGLAAIVALLTSLLLAYVPGFQQWWEVYPHKRESLAGVGFLLAWVLVGLHYAGAVDLGLGAFGWPVVWQVSEAWLAFAGMGQLSFTAQRWGKTMTRGDNG